MRMAGRAAALGLDVDMHGPAAGDGIRGVVGVSTPTFVERVRAGACGRNGPRVVGVSTPTFVERRQT